MFKHLPMCVFSSSVVVFCFTRLRCKNLEVLLPAAVEVWDMAETTSAFFSSSPAGDSSWREQGVEMRICCRMNHVHPR
ncbi:hypothetical protein JHK82_055104 [Glycine max]|uniref:Uncharacterized protein n=1 Tax=Glycine max TaxID=3847 RepID=K7N141_SOYBN|nr:hypothetical protein JHK86_054944 [Glycine max]KAG4917635.1 hypothetical protein JHK85_055916 [Glycine max]KAG5073736.1 hypothetical protein JHK84_054967 [Glycine max]KAG5076409.1 hypothetical protein JHK82_055104 [Glycine max]KAH1034310.1 hypothetical protein GYH30_054631 [Glycine max]